MSDKYPLAGKQIVITRPVHQAKNIHQKLLRHKAIVTLFPLLEIQAIVNSHHNDSNSLAFDLNQADWLIFISPNAVRYSQALLKNIDISNKVIAAIGKKTAETLRQYGITTQLVPKANFNSESFLQLPATQHVKGKRIFIMRGQGGRELLADQLRQRGAILRYVEIYRRICPSQTLENLKQQWQQQLLDIVVITSSEGLYNLYNMTKDNWIKHLPLLLGSPRMQQAANQLGHQGKIIMANNPSDETVFSALENWVQQELNK